MNRTTGGHDMQRTARLAIAALAVLGLAACQRTESQQPRAQAPPSDIRLLDAGSVPAGRPVQPPKGRVVLTLSGAIGTHNRGRNLAFDLASLERMRTVQLATTEPFLKRRVTFTGVLVRDLLAVAQVPASARKVHITALDDYKVDFTLADVASSRMLLATRIDGRSMPVAKQGPIRIVFPDGASLGRNSDLWIWSVSQMRLS
jgi:hypothetical protein